MRSVTSSVFVLSIIALAVLSSGQNTDCSAALKANGTVDIIYLQPCISSAAASSPLVLDGTRRYSGSELQALDLAYVSTALLLLAPGAIVEITSANITGVRLTSPSAVPLRVLATNVPLTAQLLLSDVTVETDCATLALYQQWFRLARPGNVSLSPEGDLLISSYTQQPGSEWTDCRLTCRRPPARTEAQPSPQPPPGSNATPSGNATVVPTTVAPTAAVTTTVDVSTDLDLFNALALAASYDAGAVVLAVRRSLALSSPLWAAQGAVLSRNVSIVGAAGGGVGGGVGGVGGKPVIDLQDLVRVVHLNDGVVLIVRGVAFANMGMVFGYAPVPFTGLGLVAPFMWFFDFQRSLAPKPPNQLQLYDCDLICYPEDIEHLNLWAMFLMASVGPLAAAAGPFRVGVNELLAESSNQQLAFTVLDAYGMTFRNVSLPSSTALNYTLTARHSPEALYKLGLPVNTTVIAIWSQSDLQAALASVQRLPACSPFSNVTAYLQLFANMSLDGTKWPQGGYNVSCNVTFAGIPNRIGSTWLNFNLLSRFLSLNNRAAFAFRSLTLFNMPSQKRTYDLGDLAQMTMPLWPVSRPAGSPPYLALYDCTIVLPYEEHRSLAATLGAADGRLPSAALNASIVAVDYEAVGTRRIQLNSFVGLNMSAVATLVTDTAASAPFAPLLGNNIYGTANVVSAPPPPPSGGALTGVAGGGGGGLSSAATVIAVAVAVPLGVALVVAVAAAYVTLRRRRRGGGGSGGARSAAYKWAGGGRDAAAAAAGAEDAAEKGGAGRSKGASGGTSPLSDQSGEVLAHGGGAGVQDSSAAKISHSESTEVAPPAPPLHMELHQLILDFAREIEDKHLTIHDALGSGGFATVYRGTWRGIDVAVKVIEFQDRSVGDERLQARAMTEAAIAANIQHANIVTTYSYDIRPAVRHDSDYDGPSGGALLGLGPAVGPGAPAAAAAGGAAGGAGGSRRPSMSSEQSGAGCRAWKLYLIQEFCEVGSLRMALENRMFQLPDGQPNLPMILRLALDVVRGLQHLHKKNIVHGDLTPGNILLKADLSRPGRYTGKLADFGLSVKMKPWETSVDNNRTGTPFYASPEVRQHGNLTKASDLYAFGVVLWEMWHGRPCYQRVRGVKHYVHAQGYPAFPPHCPPAYADLAARCLRRPLEERPPLDEVHDTLRAMRDLCAAAGSDPGSASVSDAGSTACGDDWPLAMPSMYDAGAPYGGVVNGGGGGGAGGAGAGVGMMGGGDGSGRGGMMAGGGVAGGGAGLRGAALGLPAGLGGGMGATRPRGAPARAGSWAAAITAAEGAAGPHPTRNAASVNGTAGGSRQRATLAQPAPGPAQESAETSVQGAAAPPAPPRHPGGEARAAAAQPQYEGHIALELGAARADTLHGAAQTRPRHPQQQQEPRPCEVEQAQVHQQEEQQQSQPPQQQHHHHQNAGASQASGAKGEHFFTPPGSLG